MAADSRIFTGLMLAGSVGLVVAALVASEEMDRGRLRSDEEYEGFRSCESARSVLGREPPLRLMSCTLKSSKSTAVVVVAFFAKPSTLWLLLVAFVVAFIVMDWSIASAPMLRTFIRNRFLPHCFSELKENV